MKTRLAAAAALLTIAGTAAADGYFRPADQAGPAADLEPAALGTSKATFACSLQIRYNAPTVSTQELTYIGGAGCTQAFLQAIQRATEVVPPAVKNSAPGHRADDPVYQCSTSVNFDPATARDQVELVHAGVGCESSRRVAIFTALPAVRCNYVPNQPCTP